jgi:hypothetical protein
MMRDSGPGHYTVAEGLAEDAMRTLESGDPARAAILAAIGQVHATLAAASAALHEEYGDIREWRQVTGQEGR